MSVTFKIKSFTLNSGENVSLESPDIIVIVGPNNVGKSKLLKDLESFISYGKEQTLKNRQIVTDVEVIAEGSESSIEELLKSTLHGYTNDNGTLEYRGFGASISTKQAWNNFQQAQKKSGLHSTRGVFCNLLSTENRLSQGLVESPVNITKNVPNSPLHELQWNEDEMKRFSNFFKKTFGQEIFLGMCPGSQLRLVIGDRPQIMPGEDRLSPRYLKKVEEMPSVETQGDGIKSFVSCLLWTVVKPKYVTFIDEPEAFLHPPQARILGELLAQNHKDKQLIVATHSSDILRGVLSVNSKNLLVIRLTREGNNNCIKQLNASQIQEMWSDPVLKFSNILEGVFHKDVIICESDSDCRFYSAIQEALINKNSDINTSPLPLDRMYISSGGKARIPKLVSALKALGVSVQVIADFDILNDEDNIKKTFEALGGNWEIVKSKWKFIDSALSTTIPPLPVAQISTKIKEILNTWETDSEKSEKYKDNITDLLKEKNRWSDAKRTGKAAIPSGKATQNLESLFSEMEKIKLWIVPIGELESFDRSVSRHGNEWVADVLTKDLIRSPSLKEAREFVAQFTTPNTDNNASDVTISK